MIYNEWTKMGGGNFILGDTDKCFISYQPNDIRNTARTLFSDFDRTTLDSANPETAIVLVKDKKDGTTRCLIFRGDKRDALEKLYPDVEKMKELWKKEGGHFWSDDLED